MMTIAQPVPEPDPAANAARASLPAAELAGDGSFSPVCDGLSNDFLNHYSEVLMLIEMAGDDPSIGEELARWRPVGYRDYFASSELRRAADALAAYDALPEARRHAFAKLIAAMDTLSTMAVFALEPPSQPDSARVIIEATAPALRGLIAKAAAFLNSGGRELAGDSDAEEAQAVIDGIIGQKVASPSAP